MNGACWGVFILWYCVGSGFQISLIVECKDSVSMVLFDDTKYQELNLHDATWIKHLIMILRDAPLTFLHLA